MYVYLLYGIYTYKTVAMGFNFAECIFVGNRISETVSVYQRRLKRFGYAVKSNENNSEIRVCMDVERKGTAWRYSLGKLMRGGGGGGEGGHARGERANRDEKELRECYLFDAICSTQYKNLQMNCHVWPVSVAVCLLSSCPRRNSDKKRHIQSLDEIVRHICILNEALANYESS